MPRSSARSCRSSARSTSKFWDLDDADDRVSAPIRDLGAELARSRFTGTLCSERGGHEWLADADAADMTRRHLDLARSALAEGAAPAIDHQSMRYP